MTDRYKLKGLQLAAVSFAILALSSFAVQMILVFEKSNIVYFLFMVFILVGWLLMSAACRGIMRYRQEFKMTMGISIAACTITILCAIFASSNIYKGLGKQTFISVNVMLMIFLTFLTLIMAYWYMMRGAAFMCEGFRQPKLQRRCIRIRIPALAMMIICLLVVQIAPVFTELTKYIVTAIAAMVSLLFQMLMIKDLLNVYELADGKKIPGNLQDILPGMKNVSELEMFKDKNTKTTDEKKKQNEEHEEKPKTSLLVDDDIIMPERGKSSGKDERKRGGSQERRTKSLKNENPKSHNAETSDEKMAYGNVVSGTDEIKIDEERIVKTYDIDAEEILSQAHDEKALNDREETALLSDEVSEIERKKDEESKKAELTEDGEEIVDLKENEIEKDDLNNEIKTATESDEEIVEEEWLRNEFEKIALIDKGEKPFEEFKDTMRIKTQTETGEKGEESNE